MPSVGFKKIFGKIPREAFEAHGSDQVVHSYVGVQDSLAVNGQGSVKT
jgi:hypothetical protein